MKICKVLFKEINNEVKEYENPQSIVSRLKERNKEYSDMLSKIGDL